MEKSANEVEELAKERVKENSEMNPFFKGKSFGNPGNAPQKQAPTAPK